MTGKVMVVCPLEYERKLLLKGMKRNSGVDVQSCGMGPERITKWVKDVPAGTGMVVLAGLAASLTDGCPVRMAYVIREVQGEKEDERWRCGVLREDESQLPIANVTSVQGIVGGRSERAKLHRERRVELADMESVAFVNAANARELRWVIVRGVSDSPSRPLPAGVADMADSEGRPNVMRAMAGMVMKPGSIGAMMKLRGDSKEAMGKVAGLAERMISRKAH
ncbi:MAG TPA: hypothetical protein VG711_06675 [Phycisphaerales bacterium]|nr:hypothetical protein [Phycisphaerales bacterium]